MISRNYSKNSVLTSLLVLLLAVSVGSGVVVRGGQGTPEPRREELLNGLRVFILTQPANANVTISLRINSGAAFDLMGKSGTMALLSDQLFPDPEMRDFFVDELGGSLNVSVGYDSLDIRMTGRAADFERMLEILRTALISTPITVETVTRLRTARIKMSRDLGVAVSFIADRAIANRVFADYPYGRPIGGSPDTLARIDRADLLLARERFHTSDNSTLVVIGGVQESRALRALRQLLGAWKKSDKLAPSTFRIPGAPDSATLIVDMPGAEGVEIRLATRSFARSDNDYAVASLLALILRDRWQAAFPELNRSAVFVRNESHLLSGTFVMGASVPSTAAAKALESARATTRALVDSPPSAAEIEKARTEIVALITKTAGEPASIAEMWLDAELYKLPSGTDQVRALSKVTPADIQRVAVRLLRDVPLTSVAVGSASVIKPELERVGKVEVLGERVDSKSSDSKTPVTNP